MRRFMFDHRAGDCYNPGQHYTIRKAGPDVALVSRCFNTTMTGPRSRLAMSLLDKLKSASEQPPNRRTFAGYELVELIATGPMGEVYKAIEPDTNRLVALKVLTGRSARVAERLTRDLDRKWEGERAVSLRHPNVVQSYSCGLEDGQYYLVMEYLEGSNLAAMLIRQSPRLYGHRNSIIRQIACGLAYVHEMGFIHRDICPKNAMVMPNNVAKIIDFGVALAKGNRMTDTGRRTGRPSYMAPEVVKDNIFDERTDIYALGVSMYEVVTGVKPFIGRNRYEKMQMHLHVEPVPPKEIAADVSQRLNDTIMKALVKEPGGRYQNMAELLEDL